MAILWAILLLTHVITAAAWFGLGLSLAGQARRTLAADLAIRDALHGEGARTVRLMLIFSIVTLLAGTLLMLAGGGFRAYPGQYHTAMTLMIVLVVGQLVLIGPGWRGLLGDNPENARTKVVIGTAAGHTIWLVILVLMLWWRIGHAFTHGVSQFWQTVR